MQPYYLPFREPWSPYKSWGVLPYTSYIGMSRLTGSLRNKRFQSSYCAKVRERAKKVEGGGEKRKRLPANPTIMENAP